jgi:glycosyltransferase involved in cell wall biosynthesis
VIRRNSHGGRPKTLAIVFPSTGYGGAEHYVRVIARGAVADGWRVHAAFPELPATRALQADLSADGVLCHAHAPHRDVQLSVNTVTAVRLLLWELAATFKLLIALRADSVIVSLPHPLQFDGAVLASSIVARRRAVIVFHLVSESLTASGAHRLVYRSARLFGGHWTCVSQASKRRLASSLEWPDDAIGVIRNGVPTSSPAEPRNGVNQLAARDSLRREWGVAAGEPLLLTLGRLTSQKAHDVIARSIPLVLERAPRAHWIWAGDGPLRDELAELLADLGVSDRVHLLGFRDDAKSLLSAADLFLMPSRLEGQPFALLEAAAATLPIIASDIPAIREVIRDRDSGVLVPKDDPEALAGATVWAIEHPDETAAMAARARAAIERDYSEEGMVAQTLALLDTR